MRKLALLLLLLVFPGQHNAHCPVILGIDMPKDPAKITLYFIPPFVNRPKCFVDSGEVATMNVTAGFIQIAGKSGARVDIRCVEAE